MRKNVLAFFLVLVFVAAGAMVAGTAKAATINLDLTGTTTPNNFFSFDFGGTHYDQGYWALSGLNSASSFTANQGDTINATITLPNGPFTIPASVTLTGFLFGVSSASFPSGDTGTTGTTSFFNGSSPGPSGVLTPTTTSGQLASGVNFFPPNNTAITFDKLTSIFIVDTLSQTATLDRAYMYYTLFSPSAPAPVPLPSALLLFGPGLAGLAFIRRRFGK
jgi:hypothetical protein